MLKLDVLPLVVLLSIVTKGMENVDQNLTRIIHVGWMNNAYPTIVQAKKYVNEDLKDQT